MMQYTDELEHCLWNDPHVRQVFGGVLAMDKLPRVQVPQHQRVFIINSDISSLPGRHWLLVYLQPDHAEFLDSLGLGPYHYASELSDFIFNNREKCTFNTLQLQCIDSLTCGYYCLYYAIYRSRGMSQQNILATFTQDCKYNDSLVTDFISNYFVS